MKLKELYDQLTAKIVEQKDVLQQKFELWFNNHIQADNPHQITVARIGALPDTTTVCGKPLSDGNVLLTPADVGSLPVEATAVSAQKLATPRLIKLTGLINGQVAFDGAANVQLGVTSGVAPIRYEYPDANQIHTFYEDPLYPTDVLATFNAAGQVVSCVIREPSREVSYAYSYSATGRLLSITPTVIRDELPNYEIGTSPVLTQSVVDSLVTHLDGVDPHPQYVLKD